MAAITISIPAAPGITINPTNRRVPRRLSATAFEDSNINDSGNQTEIYKDSNGNGLVATYASEIVKVGQCLAQNTNTYIEVNNNNGTIEFAGNNLVAGAAGAASGKFLIITVSGTPYKVDLLNV